MELDDKAKSAARDLSDAVNSAISASSDVNDAREYLRDLGYELHLKLEIALAKSDEEYSAEEFEMALTAEDLKTLERMKIRFE